MVTVGCGSSVGGYAGIRFVDTEELAEQLGRVGSATSARLDNSRIEIADAVTGRRRSDADLSVLRAVASTVR
jgi:hypothetical protein